MNFKIISVQPPPKTRYRINGPVYIQYYSFNGPFKSTICANTSMVPCIRPLRRFPPCHSNLSHHLPWPLLAALPCHWHPFHTTPQLLKFPSYSLTLSWMGSTGWDLSLFQTGLGLCKIFCSPKFSWHFGQAKPSCWANPTHWANPTGPPPTGPWWW